MPDNIVTNEPNEPDNVLDLNSRLDAIDAAIDKIEAGKENVSLDAGETEVHKPENTDVRSDEIEALRGTIDKQNETIDRLAKQVERMILYNGARISEKSEGMGVEAFSVEPKLGNDLPDDIPQLEDIKLGS